METEQIKEIIETIADTINKPAGDIMNIIITGKRLEGIIEISGVIIFIIIAIETYKILWSYIVETISDKKEQTVMFFVTEACLGILTLITIATIKWTIISIILPEYAIIHNLIDK